MARRLSRMDQGGWHSADCKLCGGNINRNEVESYRAIRTLPEQEHLEHVIPILENASAGVIRLGEFRSSCIRLIGTLPALYLVHRRCDKIIRYIAGCDKRIVSLLTLVSVLAPTAPVDTSNFDPLSDLDGDVLATKFNPTPMIQQDSHGFSPLSSLSLRELLINLPSELLLLILSYCPAGLALAIAVGLGDSFFDQVVRGDIARQRITVGIQVTLLLQGRAHEEINIEKDVNLSQEMVAVFVPVGGEIYLQDIREKDPCGKSSKLNIDFSLDVPPQLLALQVDHLGIRNIAFELGEDKKPNWLRNENRLAKIFVDRVTNGSFGCIRIVSDPIKVRMVDIANRSSPHPRPLLPYKLGKWVSYSVKTVRKSYLPIEGYFEPSFIELSTCKSVYLAYRQNGGICGVFNQIGEGRKEVPLGSIKEARTVRMFGLHTSDFPGGDFAHLQIQTDDGSFLPPFPDLNVYTILDKQEHSNVRGIWWGATNHQFYFNVIY